MTRGMGALVGIAVLVMAGALTLQCSTLRYVNSGGVNVVVPPPAPEASPLPVVPRLRRPRAILVLDVSGSMHESDPLFLQSEAARQFYRVYQQLSKEILEPGEQARLAVVLFSTIAQTIDWAGSREPWLEVSESNIDLFDRVVARYLGEPGTEPRVGQDTDYLAALERVEQLVSSLPDPPAIVFLTDGAYDLNPVFSPLLPAEARSQWLRRLPESSHDTVRAVQGGAQDFLSAPSFPPAFDARTTGAQGLALPPELDASAQAAIADALTRLLGRRDGGIGPFWAPLFLGSSSTGGNSARDLLTGDVSTAGGAEAFTQVSDARDLSSAFVAALARWLQLREVHLPTPTAAIVVPEGVAAFAINLRTTRPGTHATLTQNGERVSLSGREGTWAGVIAGGGRWEIETDGGDVIAGRVFLRPRHEWVLLAPPRMRLTTGDETLPLELRLVELGTAEAAGMAELPPGLPGAIPVVLLGAGTEIRGQLTRLDTPAGRGYRGDIPLRGLGVGAVRVSVDVSPLALPELPVFSDHVEHQLSVEPGLEVIVLTHDGRRTLPNIEGVPREAEGVRRFVNAWLPRALQPDGGR